MTCFPQQLRLTGVRAKLLDGMSLQGKRDVIGMTTGAPQLGISKSRCRFLPGAFCDNLTSEGGRFYAPKKPPGQTCISEFLRLGAAGACGTVVEPFAIRQKFPLPTIHVHYAHGCSLAEAFYQSVPGPYQQLLVGDPLCQPWADRPVVKVKGISDKSTLKGTVTVVPSATIKKTMGISTFDLFADGVQIQQCQPGGKFSLDTSLLADGEHELSVVATTNSPIETQGRWIGTVQIKNGHDAVQLTVDQSSRLSSSKQLAIKVTSTQKKVIWVMHNGRKMGRVVGGNGIVRIDNDRLGNGPMAFYGQSEGKLGIRSKSLRIELKN